MFSGLDFSGQAAPPAAQSPEADFFGGTQASGPPRGDRTVGGSSDPFGTFQSGPSSTQAAEPLAAVFGGLSVGQTSQPAVPKGPVDLLGGLDSTPNNHAGTSTATSTSLVLMRLNESLQGEMHGSNKFYFSSITNTDMHSISKCRKTTHLSKSKD